MNRRERRPRRTPPWYLLTGLLMGLMLGLIYSLAISPVRYMNTSPDRMSEESKDYYRILIARSYEMDKDVGRAAARLALLKDEDVLTSLTEQSGRLVLKGGYADDAKALLALADDLQKAAASQPSLIEPAPDESEAETSGDEISMLLTPTQEAAQAVRTPTPAAEATSAPAATFTPRVTSIPQSVLSAPFKVQASEKLCDPDRQTPLLAVEVLDNNGQPLPGVRIQVAWEDGEDTFFTGLFPYLSPGYADFEMAAGLVYTLRAGDSGEIVRDLNVQDCEDEDGGNYPGGWLLTLAEP